MSILSVLTKRKDLDAQKLLDIIVRADDIVVSDDFFIVSFPLESGNSLLLTKSSKPRYSFKHQRALVKFIDRSIKEGKTLETQVNYIEQSKEFQNNIEQMKHLLVKLDFDYVGNNTYVKGS